MAVVFGAEGNIDWENSVDDPEMEEEPRYACPVCGEITLPYRGSHYMCDNCCWFDDPGQSEDDPDEADGENRISLNEARERYKKGLPVHKGKGE